MSVKHQWKQRLCDYLPIGIVACKCRWWKRLFYLLTLYEPVCKCEKSDPCPEISEDKRFLRCATCGKPIPAEKKECKHDWRCKDQFTGDKQYKGFLICIKCKDEFDARLEPEPKPKDRIESIELVLAKGMQEDDFVAMPVKSYRQIIDAINKLIQDHTTLCVVVEELAKDIKER